MLATPHERHVDLCEHPPLPVPRLTPAQPFSPSPGVTSLRQPQLPTSLELVSALCPQTVSVSRSLVLTVLESPAEVSPCDFIWSKSSASNLALELTKPR